MRRLLLVLLLIVVLSLVACGGESAPAGDQGEVAGAGDAAAGRRLFDQNLIGTQAGCMTCHSLEPGVNMVGPSLANIGADAGSRVPGVSAEEYLQEAITMPDAHIVEGFSPGIMPAALAEELSAQDVDNLVAFLLTLQ
jgi:cytochrome c551/c552